MASISPEPAEPPDPPPVVMSSTAIASLQSSRNKRPAEAMEDGQDAPRGKVHISDRESAIPSIQTVYTHPSFSVLGIKEYESTDTGPFIVHVSKTESDPSAGTTFRAIKFGQFLFSNKIENICRDGVKRIGRNRMSVQFKTAEAANIFLSSPLISAQKHEASIPSYNVSRMGVVHGVPVDWSMDQFVSSVEIPNGSSYILKARRFNRKVKHDSTISWEPTQTVVLTFRGQHLPAKIYSFYSALNVEVYEFPTIQCLACCRFGHIRSQCRSAPRCFRCAQPHTGDQCTVQESSSTCLYCSATHFATSKVCPEQARQKSIKSAMAREGISYQEASLLYRSSKTFSEVVKSAQHVSIPNSDHVSTPVQSVPQHTLSYRKTVFRNPSIRPAMGKSYDKVAHQAITRVEQSPSSNGIALQMTQPSQSLSSEIPQNDILVQLLSLIINIISQNSLKLPHHVAQSISHLTALLSQNGSVSNPSMELQEPSSEGF